MILASDLGGTNCRLAVFDDNFLIVEQRTYKTKDYKSFEEVVVNFVEDCKHPIRGACFGLAGPVREGKCKITNLPWEEVDSAKLARIIGVPVALLNDLEANAYGLETLRGSDLAVLNVGSKLPGGNRAVMAPGTGLGEAALIEVNGRIHAMASEGGHADFAPVDELQFGLMRYVQREYKKVSYEMVLGGPGLLRIYNYLLECGSGTRPEWLAEKMKGEDPAAAISHAALENKCQVCAQALDLFVSILAAEAGNVAVKFLAVGGLYLGGGIPPRILDKLQAPPFMEHFFNKDQMSSLLKSIPVYVILNELTALQGAAWYGRRALLFRVSGK